MTGIRLYNDPNLFGRVPDPPEPPECPETGKIEEICECCSNYEECKKMYESEEEDDS